jgi:hypothetical protein
MYCKAGSFISDIINLINIFPSDFGTREARAGGQGKGFAG